MATGSVRDNKTLSRFELDAEGGLAFANYRLTPSAVIITHTETPRSLRGRGIASELLKGALHLIRAGARDSANPESRSYRLEIPGSTLCVAPE